MRTHKGLYFKIISFQNLLLASKLAQRGKRFKDSTAKFNFQLEKELWCLQAELAEKRYEPGRLRHFTIYEPKKRIISAAPYRDRVVHHAINNILEPIFEPVFIYDSYATSKGKGTHAAIDRFQEFSRKNRYVIKCDIQRYFPSIDHDVLMGLLRRKIACKETLCLIEKIIRSSSVDGKGIPIGNLTSQFFANIYLDGLDHYIKERLGCRYYLRYMDDFVVFHNDKAFLWAVKTYIVRHLAKLRLQIHENKCRIFRTEKGTPFLGLIVFPNHRRLKGENVVRFKRRLKRFQALYKTGSLNWKNIIQSIRAWIGHAMHADTVKLRKLVIEEAVF